MNTTSARKHSVTLLPLPSAYLLVSHGSRDPRPQAAVDQLADFLKLRVEGINKVQGDGGELKSNSSLLSPRQAIRPSLCLSPALLPLVGTATLELATLPLHEQIRQFGYRAKAAGFRHLLVLPLFLLPGVHVMEDIPAEVALAQQSLGSDLTIDLRPHLGTHPELGCLLATQMAAVEAEARILLSHGSRRRGGNQPVAAVAAQLEAVAAFWSVPPSLNERVEEFVEAGYEQIAILPYFLFAGGITDAIAQAVVQLQEQFPNVQLSLSEPIGASLELADLILDLLHFNL